MSKAEQVVEDMALQPDPEVTEFFFGLFTREAMLGYAGVFIKILIVIGAVLILTIIRFGKAQIHCL